MQIEGNKEANRSKRGSALRLHHPQYVLGEQALKPARLSVSERELASHTHASRLQPWQRRAGSHAANQSPGQLSHWSSSWWNGLWWWRRRQYIASVLPCCSGACWRARGWGEPSRKQMWKVHLLHLSSALKRVPRESLNFRPTLSGKSLWINDYDILTI